jgi:hypothetical protein
MITREQAVKIAKRYGIEEIPRDDPIYKEPPTIRFVSSTTHRDVQQREKTDDR